MLCDTNPGLSVLHGIVNSGSLDKLTFLCEDILTDHCYVL